MKRNLDIQQVIVVEGKTDTQKLQKIFGDEIQTIETNGLNLTPEVIELIKQINKNQGIIIFTDPDGPGKKIRQKLDQALDGEVKHAFITKKDINQKSKKIGIAEADEEAIEHALENLITFKKHRQTISWKEYLINDFYLKKNRLKITAYFHFDEKTSSKTLYKWLNLMGLDVSDIKKILNRKGS